MVPSSEAEANDARASSGAPRPKLGIAFSGGGFRATLFHLGVVAELRQRGLLGDVTGMCSVSGGSIIAAHLVKNWSAYNSKDFWSISRALVDFTQRDVRGHVVRAWLMLTLVRLPLSGLQWACFFSASLRRSIKRWRHRYTRVGLLRSAYDSLYDCAEFDACRGCGPDLHVLASSLTSGRLCSFTKDGFQTTQLLEGEEVPLRVATHKIPLSLAVTSSSAFPPLFPPVTVDAATLHARNEQFLLTHRLSDGGIFDNLGVRRFIQLLKTRETACNWIIVSDAGAKLDVDFERTFLSALSRNVRASDLMMNRVGSLENEGAGRSFEDQGATMIPCCIQKALPAGSSSMLDEGTQRDLAAIRTDLDGFSCEEVRLLIQHGRAVACEAIGQTELGRRYPREGPEGGTVDPDWLKLKPGDEKALEGSKEIRLRLFDGRDWASWASAAALIVAGLLCLAPYLSIHLTAKGQAATIATQRNEIHQLKQAKIKQPIDVAIILNGEVFYTREILSGFTSRLDELLEPTLYTARYEWVVGLPEASKTDGNRLLLKSLLGKFDGRNPNYLVTVGTQVSEVAYADYHGKIPIVFCGVTDPVGSGLVKTYERSGDEEGVAGVDYYYPVEKHLQLLRECFGDVRFGYLYSREFHQDVLIKTKIDQIVAAAGAPRVTCLEVSGGIDANVDAAADVFFGRYYVTANLQAILSRTRKPVVAADSSNLFKGAVMSISTQPRDLGFSAAKLLNDHLIGGRPLNTIPVVRGNDDLHIGVNLHAAMERKTTIPEDVRKRAEMIVP